MQKHLFQEQINALKKHPLIKKVQAVADRLIKLIYSPHIDKSKRGETSWQYAGQSYRIKIQLPLSYPEQPPNIKFVDSISHVNICSQQGLVYMPLLGEDWCPYLNLFSVIDALNNLLNEPQMNSYYYPNQENGVQKMSHRSKNQDQLNNHEAGLSRKLKRTFSKLSVVSLVPPALDDQQFSDQPTTPTTPQVVNQKKGKLRRLKTLVQSTSNQFMEKQQKSIADSQKMAKVFNPSLSNIHQVSDQHLSKNFSQLIQSIPSPYFRNNKAQKNKRQVSSNNSCLSTSFIKLEQVKPSDSKEQKAAQHLKNSDRNIAKTTRKSIIKNHGPTSASQHNSPSLIPTLNRKFLQDYPTQRKQKSVVLTNTVQLDGPSKHLKTINSTLNVFYRQYQQLAKKIDTVSCQVIRRRIDKRLTEQISMIQQLQSLALEVKQSMVSRIKKQIK